MKQPSIEQLLEDSGFRKWVEEPGSREAEYWRHYLQAHPEQEELLLTAKAMVQGLPFQRRNMEDDLIEQRLAELDQRISRADRYSYRIRRIRFLRVAAALVLLIGITVTWQWLVRRPQTLQTGYGEISEIRKLKGAQGEVVLNAGSRLRFMGHTQEAHLQQGEAFFSITPRQGPPFRVNAGGAVVEVLGTAFSVSLYEEPKVILQEGKVRITYRGQERFLVPGQEAVLRNDSLLLRPVEVAQALAWLNRKWSFGDGTPWSEVALRIERHFGMDVIVEDPAILRRQVSGDVTISTPEALFQALEAYSSLDLEWTEHTLTVSE